MQETTKPPSHDPRWTSDGPNILSIDSLARIEHALCEDWIGGIHFYYGAGCSPDDVVFSNLDTFLAHVKASRPGDAFILWSVAEMRRRKILLADNSYEEGIAGNSLLPATDLDRVRTYLDETEFNEILCFVSQSAGNVETFCSDRDSSEWESFLNAVHRAAVPGGRLCVLPLTKIDLPDLYLVKAKRPNEQGQVPVSGAY